MINKRKKIAQLLGMYLDEEQELVNLYESKIIHEGIWFKLPLSKINLFHEPLKGFFDNFTLIDNGKKLRENLNKPYLALDEVYELSFCINKLKKLSQNITLELDFSFDSHLDISINYDNISFWKEALKQKFILVQIKRIKVKNK